MKSSKASILKVFRAFSKTYQEREKPQANDLWQMKVMSHIRSMDPLNSRVNYFMLVDRFVWKFAAAACFAAVILSLYVIQTGFQPEYELAKVYMENPVEFNFLKSLEIL